VFVALLGATSSTASEQAYASAEGCPERSGQPQSYCPRYFRDLGSNSPWLPFDINRPKTGANTDIQYKAPTNLQLTKAALVHRLDEPQETPCISTAASCYKGGAGTIECEQGMRSMDESFYQVLEWSQLIPGSPSACGHGNREFSFFVRPADRRASLEKVIVVFAAGGICWDAESCGNTNNQRMGSGNNAWSSPHMKSPAIPERLLEYLWSSEDSKSKPGILGNGQFSEYDSVLIPDCTGDMNIGNRSYTYGAVHNESCVTAHHRGGINTGLAIDWIVHPRNSRSLREVLIVATGYNDMGQGRAFGGHGPAFWAAYIQKRKPDVTVRVVTEQSLGINGPAWSKVMEPDPWGTQQLFEPGTATPVLPPPSDWSFAHDDMTSYYEYVAKTSPSVAFADVSSMHDPSQMGLFEHFGGHRRQCCVDGCSCQSGGDDTMEAGHLDWIKTLKVAVLQRHQRLGQNYRSWLSKTPVRYSMLSTLAQLETYLTSIGATQWSGEQVEMTSICPKVRGSTKCPEDAGAKFASPSILDQFVRAFGESKIVLDGVGGIKSEHLPGRTYHERVFGDFTCTGCLDGVPGGNHPGDERCNATFAQGETLFSVAPKYNMDWMLMWSLNSGDAPDTATKPGAPYRFAHQYVMQPGDTIESVAKVLATTAGAIINLNRNRITHFEDPSKLRAGDTICVLPSIIDVRDRFGSHVCPDHLKHRGEPYTVETPRI